ncbi:MAG TPA: XrtA-associated tyrosine autokinase [Noviherbaspirillum sp.]|nr:XrtA-associated tyrosine autokinase [Noviherbaspirillum sp.]
MSIIEKAAKRLGQETQAVVQRPNAEFPPKETTNANENVAICFQNHSASKPPRVVAQQEINLAQLHKLGMVTPNGGRTQVSEEFRFIKRPLIKNAPHRSESGNPGNLIMVTSSLPGEGKTFCAVNLAMSIAMEMDRTVLLVDADAARPSVLRTLGLHSDTGLMDVLLDDSLDLADVMIKTNVETLSVLPAGKNHKHATELLASQSMSKLLVQIANRYPDRIVIFDAPPLLITSEARVLASQMGQIVMVVEAEKTTQNALKDALRKIGTCSNVSLVYNKGRDFPEGENYSYYYG